MNSPSIENRALIWQYLDIFLATRQQIVAITANAFGEDRQVCIYAGRNKHIGKRAFLING